MLHSHVFSALMNEQICSEAFPRLGWDQRLALWVYHWNLCRSHSVHIRFLCSLGSVIQHQQGAPVCRGRALHPASSLSQHLARWALQWLFRGGCGIHFAPWGRVTPGTLRADPGGRQQCNGAAPMAMGSSRSAARRWLWDSLLLGHQLADVSVRSQSHGLWGERFREQKGRWVVRVQAISAARFLLSSQIVGDHFA